MEHGIISGEVWVDERGEAIVVLPDHLQGREHEVEHRLRCSDPAARTSAALVDGHLTITSELPHVKVAWRLAYRTTAGCRVQERGKEMKTGFLTRKGLFVLAAAVALLAVAASSAYAEIRGDGGARAFVATFETRAAATPETRSCSSLPAVQKIEGRYTGRFAVLSDPPTEADPPTEFSLNFTLEILYDRSTGVGTARGSWQLAQPPEPDLVGRGELVAVVKAVDAQPPEPDAQPPEPDLELDGLLIGSVSPSDPGLPAQTLIGNFMGSITDGTLNFTGAVGDPTGLSSNPAALLPAVKC